VTIPSGVEIAIDGTEVTVKGPKGTLSQVVPADMLVQIDDGALTVSRPTDGREHRSLHGLTRTLIANMVEGVTNGYEKRLEIVGVGYRAAIKERDIEFALGFSHTILFAAPEGIEFEVPAPTRVTVRGIDKQQVGQVAANIRKLRKPEPYKGKGIRYEGEKVRKKAGKAAKGGG
jgi:large subunit ribosomal protein L6